MKKQILLLCMIFISALTFGQMTSKNGHTILPEAGDWAIQMNAVPLVNMALNAMDIMNDSGNNAAHPDYVTGFSNVIVGKYFHDANTATRVKIALESGTAIERSFGDDPTTAEEENDVKLGSLTTNWWDLTLGYGKEYRRGHNRLQGFYGYEGLVKIANGEVVDSTGLGSNYSVNYEIATADLGGIGSYPLSGNDGLSFELGARVFVGVEYFAAPKISVGAEFGWGFMMEMSGKGSSTTEDVAQAMTDDNNLVWNDDGTAVLETTEVEMPGDSNGMGFGFDVDNYKAALTVSFHF